MKIEWVRKKDGNTADITEVISSVTWAGSCSQVARTAELSVINAPDDANIKSIDIAISAGDIIKLYDNNAEIFYGEVQTIEKLSESGTVTYSCSDLLSHLLRSAETDNYSNTTAEDITKKLCAKFQIAAGNIAETKVPIKKMIVDGDSIYDIIMMAYTKAAKQTGQFYICRMDQNKLSVEIKGTKLDTFMLADEYNISNANYQETIENMVNQIKIVDDKGNQIGEVKQDDWIRNFGIYQQIYKKEDGINETTAATEMLIGIEKTVSITGIDAPVNCIAGNGVEVYDSATQLTGLFWIESDSHTWENGTHIVNLELSFKNVMDSKENSAAED